MKALISILEPRETGYRVAQVVSDNQIFPVAEPDMFWVSCANDVEQDKFWYDPSDQTIKSFPTPPVHIPTAEENGATAVSLLAATDWVNQPDVTNSDINPHLLNHADFIIYRSQVRAIAISPTAGDLTWPVQPTPSWSSV